MKLLTSLFLLAFASTANAYVVKETTFPANWPTAAPTEEIVKWGESDSPLGSGATISYSFNTVDLASLMPSGYENILISAFDTWSSVADLSFNYSASDADIVFGTEDIDNKYGVSTLSDT